MMFTASTGFRGPPHGKDMKSTLEFPVSPSIKVTKFDLSITQIKLMLNLG